MEIRPRRVLGHVALFVLLALTVNFVLSRTTNLGTALRAAGRFPVELIAIAAVAEILRFVAGGEFVKSAARAVGERVPLGPATELFLASGSAGLLFGGAALTVAVSYHWLRHRGLGAGAASLASWAPTAFDNLALLAFSAVGLLCFFLLLPSSLPVALSSLSSLGLLVALTVATLVAVRLRERVVPVAARIAGRAAVIARRPVDEARLRAAIRRPLDAAAELGRGRWKSPLLWALLGNALDAIALHALFRAAGRPIGVAALVAGWAFPALIGRVAPIPGGVGVVEAGMVGAYVALGVAKETAVAVVLGYRLVSFWIPHLLGLGLALRLQHGASRSE